MVRPSTQAGFTLLEIVIVVALVVLLFLVAVDRLLPLRGQAEAAHVRQVVGTLRSSLGLTVAERVVDGGLRTAVALDGSDPMTLVARPPPNYVGVLNAKDAAEPGTWYFDPLTRRLGYRVEFTSYLVGSPAAASLHWRIDVEHSPGQAGSVQLRADRHNPAWAHELADSSTRVRP